MNSKTSCGSPCQSNWATPSRRHGGRSCRSVLPGCCVDWRSSTFRAAEVTSRPPASVAVSPRPAISPASHSPLLPASPSVRSSARRHLSLPWAGAWLYSHLSWTKATPDANVSAIIAAAGSAASDLDDSWQSAHRGDPVPRDPRTRTPQDSVGPIAAPGVQRDRCTGVHRPRQLDRAEDRRPGDPRPRAGPLTFGDILWAIPLAIVIAASTWLVFEIGKRTAKLAESRLMTTTIAAGLFTGCCAAVYSLVTGHSPAEVAMSGQATLVPLATDPGEWSTVALAMLFLCKGLAYAVCLGTFRGGPVFPALMLGATFGVLASAIVPSIGTVTGVAIGMAAGVAVTRHTDHQCVVDRSPARRCGHQPDACRHPGRCRRHGGRRDAHQ